MPRMMKRAMFLAFKVLAKLSGRPLRNSVLANWLQWSSWDWAKGGEEWSNTAEWKASLVRNVLEPHVKPGSRVLEIGAGAGRWSSILVDRASYLCLVDLTSEAIEICRDKFRDRNNVEFFVNNGRDLSFVKQASIDCIWSWDVFVHIQSADIDGYLSQFANILVPGGRGLLHHSKHGVNRRGWRSDMTAAKMVAACESHGLKVIAQFDSWDGGRMRIWPGLSEPDQPDSITVFERPVECN